MVPMMVLALFACDDNDLDLPNPTTPDTALITENVNGDVESAYAGIKNRIEADESLSVIAEINHTFNAIAVGQSLRPTQLIVFGNPQVGTQMMQKDQRIGIDLPLKALVWRDEDFQTKVSFYNASTLTDRYDIEGLDELVSNVNDKLATITGTDEDDEELATASLEGDMVMMMSSMSVAETYARIRGGITSRGLGIMKEINHSQAAENAGLELRPTRLIMFGNPEVGTQMIKKNQQIGVDLPMKMLIWENAAGETWVGYYKATTLVDVYDIDGLDDVAQNVDNTLSAIANEGVSR